MRHGRVVALLLPSSGREHGGCLHKQRGYIFKPANLGILTTGAARLNPFPSLLTRYWVAPHHGDRIPLQNQANGKQRRQSKLDVFVLNSLLQPETSKHRHGSAGKPTFLPAHPLPSQKITVPEIIH